MSEVVLEAVSRCYGQTKAVDAFTLTVGEGEFVTFLGPSGCGKTTTLRMVAGLEPNDSGRITIGGNVVSDATASVFVPPERRQLGMVFQSYAIWPHLTVFENVAYPLRVKRVAGKEVSKRVEMALRLVEMTNFADRPAPLLSGGQQQRVAIARALVVEPEVLLLDEPLSNLDAKLRTQMGVEFRALQKRLGITTLYVTHDQEEALALSDRVVVMRAGQILQVDSPERLYSRPATKAVAAFFGSPNFVAARVRSCTPHSCLKGHYELVVEGLGWKGRCLSGEVLPTGTSVEVMVRPEGIGLAPGGNEDATEKIVWTGRVTQRVFRGARIALEVDVAGQPINVDISGTSTLAPGESTNLIVDPSSTWVMRPREDEGLAKADGAHGRMKVHQQVEGTAGQ